MPDAAMSNPATTSAPARPAFPRHPRLRSFARTFGRAHLSLACHAAFPIALTPDLLYQLWDHFPRDVLDQPIGAPWVAVADLLLSTLCDEVGHELFELDPAVRDELLAELSASPRFGPQRVAELSRFVSQYVEQQLRSSDPFVRDFAEAQHWAARAAVDPAAAAGELARAYAELDGTDRERLLRLESIVAALARPERAGELESLMPYARALADWARGDTARAATVLRAMASAGGQIQIGGLVLPVPQPVAVAPAGQANANVVQPGDVGEVVQTSDVGEVAQQAETPASADNEQLAQLRQQRDMALRRLRALEQQQAYLGLNTSASILIDIKEQQGLITRLDAQIQALDPSSGSAASTDPGAEIAHLQTLYTTQQRRLRILEEQVAAFSEPQAPVQLIAQLQAVQDEIAKTEQRLRQLDAQPGTGDASPAPDTAAPAPLSDDEREQLLQLRAAHQRRLYGLEERQAQYGPHVAPPEITMEIEDLRAKIADIDHQLGGVPPTDDDPAHLERLRAMHQTNLKRLEAQSVRYGASVPAHITLEIEDLRVQIAELDRRLAQTAPDLPSQAAAPNLAEAQQAAAPPNPPEAAQAAAPAETAAPAPADTPTQAITIHIARQAQGFSVDLNDGTSWQRASLVLSDEQLGELVGAAREALKEIVFTQIAGQYVYQVPSTTIAPGVHAQSLQKLARAGARLYQQLFDRPGSGDDTRVLGARLSELSRGARLRIRIVAERFFIPWVLLYDRALAEADQIDPEGFWGFRHVIECQVPSSLPRQPGVLGEEAEADRTLSSLPRQPGVLGEAAEPGVRPAIEPAGQFELAFVGNNALDEKFQQLEQPIVQTQRAFMAALPNVRLAELATVADLHALLNDAENPAQLIYFYCQLVHKRATDVGGIDASALGLTDGRVTLAELKQRTPASLRLPAAPLVFLNTASSAELDPASFDGFTPFFLAHGARSVIGSETNMPAVFGAEFGQEFVKRFVAGEQSAGDLLLNLRRAYLLQRNNLLGLLYTLYGDSDARVVWPAPAEPATPEPPRKAPQRASKRSAASKAAAEPEPPPRDLGRLP